MHLQVIATRIHRAVQHPAVWFPAVLLIGVYVWFELHHVGHLDTILSASSNLMRGDLVYSVLHSGEQFTQSPLVATLLYPLTIFPPWAARLLWLILQIWLCWRIWEVFLSLLQATWFRESLQTVFGIVVLVACTGLIHLNLRSGHLVIPALWAVFEGLSMIRQGRSTTGGFLLALAVHLQFISVVIWPWLIFRRDWKSVLIATGTSAVLLVTPAIWLGTDRHAELLHDWWAICGTDYLNSSTRDGHFQSLNNLLTAYFGEEKNIQEGITVRRQITELKPSTIDVVLFLSRTILILSALYMSFRKPFSRLRKASRMFYEVSSILLITPLIFANQTTGSFLLVLPALCWILYGWFEQRILGSGKIPWAERATLSLLIILFNLPTWAGRWNQWFDYFMITGLAALILICWMILRRPAKESIRKQSA